MRASHGRCTRPPQGPCWVRPRPGGAPTGGATRPPPPRAPGGSRGLRDRPVQPRRRPAGGQRDASPEPRAASRRRGRGRGRQAGRAWYARFARALHAAAPRCVLGPAPSWGCFNRRGNGPIDRPGSARTTA